MFDVSIKTKSYFVIILMVGCFAILYPKILHPMILHLLGIRSGESVQNDFVHPRDRHVKVNPESSKTAFTGHSPHPGRINTEKPSQSGRGGVMTMVLPVYAIGIIFYLIYTLVKVFGGSKSNMKKEKRESILKNYYRDFHYDPNVGSFKMNYNDKENDLVDDLSQNSYRYRGPDDIYDTTKTLPHDLEILLQKVDDKNINEEEMSQLRIRLEQTEAQLTRILSAIEQLDVNPKVESQNFYPEANLNSLPDSKRIDESNNDLEINDPEILDKHAEDFEDCTENMENSNVMPESEVIHRHPIKMEES